MRAGRLVSESGDVTLHGKDIQLAAGHEKKHDAYGQQYKAQGLFSSTKTTLAYDSQKDTVLAPILIDRNITLNAENSIKAAAPRLAAEQDITLKAANISLAAEATHEKEGWHRTRRFQAASHEIGKDSRKDPRPLRSGQRGVQKHKSQQVSPIVEAV